MRNKANQLWHTDSSFKSHAGAGLGALGAHHSGRRRRDRIRLDPACLRAARSGAAAATGKLVRLAPLWPFARQDRARSGERRRAAPRCRRCAGAWCGRTRSTGGARSISPRTLTRSRAWTPKAGEKFIEDLTAAATAPGTTYEHKWRQGDVVMWDNRATMHRGRPWPGNEPRYMVRTTISATAADGVESVRPPPRLAAE